MQTHTHTYTPHTHTQTNASENIFPRFSGDNKKLSYRRGTARRTMTADIFPTAAQL